MILVKFLIKAEELMITSGKNPVAMAATVVYLAAITNGEKVSQTQVSKAANISSVTIRNLCKKLKDAKNTFEKHTQNALNIC